MRAEGKVFGRAQKLTTHRRHEVLARLHAGETICEITLSYNVAHITIARHNKTEARL